jgi:hypothetical protein
VQPFKKPLVRKHLSGFGQNSEMFFRGLHGHQKYEYVGHRLAVRGFERNRRFKAHVANEYPVKVLNASMRNSDPLTQAGRSDLFPEGETARHRLLRQGVRPLHVAADFVNKLRISAIADGRFRLMADGVSA